MGGGEGFLALRVTPRGLPCPRTSVPNLACSARLERDVVRFDPGIQYEQPEYWETSVSECFAGRIAGAGIVICVMRRTGNATGPRCRGTGCRRMKKTAVAEMTEYPKWIRRPAIEGQIVVTDRGRTVAKFCPMRVRAITKTEPRPAETGTAVFRETHSIALRR